MAIDWTPLADCVTGLSREADIGASVVAPDGSAWAVQGDVQFPSASTAKIPIMIEVWRMIDRGEAALDDIHPVTRADKSNGSGVLRLMHAGLPVSLADLLYLMMAISDNTATNMLIRLAGIERINATMQELGMARSVLGRLMVGRLAIEGEQENLATPDDYTRVLDAIFSGRAASPEACTAMIATLERQQNARRIGRFVPTAPGWRWGSKTGSNTGVVNDAGFVIGPQGRMLVSVYVRGVEDMVEGERIIAMVTWAAMEACGLR
jgi:beta-lactamase class A